MILAGGRILDTDRQEELLDTLEDRINRTREQGSFRPRQSSRPPTVWER